MSFSIRNGFTDDVARAPEIEELVSGSLVSIVSERSAISGETLYRYYVDGKARVAYSTVDLALKQGRKYATRLEEERREKRNG